MRYHKETNYEMSVNEVKMN